jgi:hypothetical protein
MSKIERRQILNERSFAWMAPTGAAICFFGRAILSDSAGNHSRASHKSTMQTGAVGGTSFKFGSSPPDRVALKLAVIFSLFE